MEYLFFLPGRIQSSPEVKRIIVRNLKLLYTSNKNITQYLITMT